MKEKLGLAIPILVDPDLAVIKSYGILNEEAGDIPHPTAMIVDKAGNVAYLFAEPDYSVRPESSDMIDVLETLANAETSSPETAGVSEIESTAETEAAEASP